MLSKIEKRKYIAANSYAVLNGVNWKSFSHDCTEYVRGIAILFNGVKTLPFSLFDSLGSALKVGKSWKRHSPGIVRHARAMLLTHILCIWACVREWLTIRYAYKAMAQG